MRNTRNLSLALVAALALGTAACSKNATSDEAVATDSADIADTASSTAAPGDTATSGAAQFLTDAMKGDNSEIKLGKLAVSKSASSGVQNFGNMLVEDHGKAKRDVVSLATSMNIPTTDDTTPDADAEYTKLQGMSGADFDKEFVSFMVQGHQKAIAQFQQEAASNDPQPVKQLASQTLPTLQKHLKTAQSLQQK
jgi:putative membrane protein